MQTFSLKQELSNRKEEKLWANAANYKIASTIEINIYLMEAIQSINKLFPSKEYSLYLCGHYEGDVLVIEDAIFPEQENTATTTTIEDSEVNALLLANLPDGMSYVSWYHSHHNMGTGPSGQDEKQHKENITYGPYVRIIGTNALGYSVLQSFMVDGIQVDISIDDFCIYDGEPCELIYEDWTYVEDSAKAVATPSYTYVNNNNYGNYNKKKNKKKESEQIYLGWDEEHIMDGHNYEEASWLSELGVH